MYTLNKNIKYKLIYSNNYNSIITFIIRACHRMWRMPLPGALIQGPVNSHFYAQLGIGPSIVVKFHQIPTRFPNKSYTFNAVH